MTFKVTHRIGSLQSTVAVLELMIISEISFHYLHDTIEFNCRWWHQIFEIHISLGTMPSTRGHLYTVVAMGILNRRCVNTELLQEPITRVF